MSYEGSSEYICPNGHYWCVDVWNDHGPPVCPTCEAPARWYCSIDETNGEDEANPHTLPGPRVPAGAEDIWRKDHYGNPFAMSLDLWAPDLESGRWRELDPK